MGFSSTEMAANGSNQADNVPNEVRNRHMVNLVLMRSIKCLKDHIVVVQDKLRDVSGLVAESRDNCDKAEKELIRLTAIADEMVEELKKLEKQQDLRDSDDIIDDGADSDASDTPNNGDNA